MDKQGVEKEFLDNLERILGGQEIESGLLSEDCRTALDFVKKITRLRVVPSVTFHNGLKEKLLLRLEKQETTTVSEKQGLFWERLWETWRQPVWRTVTVGLIAALIIVGVMGRVGMFTHFAPQSPEPASVPAPQPAPTPAPEPAPAPGITFFIEGDAILNKDAYIMGEDVVIELLFENSTGEDLDLEPFPPEVRIMRRYPYDEIAHVFPAGEGSRSLEPGETASYVLTWNQRDDQGEPVSYGRYYLEFGLVRHGDGWITIGRHRYISFLILPEEGAIEETIEINEPKTANGITITLERVELTAAGARFYAFNIPPDYDLPQDPDLPPPPLMSLHAEAEYSLDGKQTIKAGLSGIRFLDNGIKHTWDMLDPVPEGTRELTFTITKLGDYAGPWEFIIPLE